MEIFLQNFVSFFTVTYVPLDEYVPFYRKQFFLLFKDIINPSNCLLKNKQLQEWINNIKYH